MEAKQREWQMAESRKQGRQARMQAIKTTPLKKKEESFKQAYLAKGQGHSKVNLAWAGRRTVAATAGPDGRATQPAACSDAASWLLACWLRSGAHLLLAQARKLLASYQLTVATRKLTQLNVGLCV